MRGTEAHEERAGFPDRSPRAQPGGGRPGRTALVLLGGGFPGYLFEIGALTALDDLFEEGFDTTAFDFYVGISAGAAAAALVANGVRPEEVFLANLSAERPYYFERRDIFVPAVGEGLKTAWRLLRRSIPLVRLYLRHRPEMSVIDLLDRAQDALPSGLYTLEPFARYLEATFAAKGLSNSFAGLRKELYIPAIDLATGRSVVFGPADAGRVPIARAVAASSAAPIFFCPVRIGGRDYIDAGIGRIESIDLALAKGADLTVMITPMLPVPDDPAARDADGSRCPPLRGRGVLAIGDQASRINLEARLSLALKLARSEHPEKEFFVISPRPSDPLMFERSFLSFRDRGRLLECGYRAVVDRISAHLADDRARFARTGIAISLHRLAARWRRRREQLGWPPPAEPVAAMCRPRPDWSSAV